MIGRRRLLAGMGTLSALALMVGTPSLAQEEQITLRMSWFGNDARHALYNRLLDIYEEQNPNINVEREFTGFDAYWPKLATQAAGGNPPDLIVQHLSYIHEYVDRGVLMSLDEYVESGRIDLSNFSEGAIQSGVVDGSIYMITLGLTPRGLFYNPEIFEAAGLDRPDGSWTWSEWADAMVTIREELGDQGIYGTTDQGTGLAFDIFLGQRGKETYADGGLGFTKEDLRDFWAIWEDLRARGALPSPDQVTDMEATNQNHADAAFSNGKLATWIAPGNQFKLFAQYSEDELEITEIPVVEDGQPYNFAAGAFMSIASASDHPDAVADLINWFVNDEEVALIYNGEHGPPGSRKVQEVLIPNLEPADQKLYAFSDSVSDYVQPQSGGIPESSELNAAMDRIYDQLQFGQITLDEAVDLYFEEADFILNG